VTNPAEDALWALHSPLVHEIKSRPEYRDNTETAIYGYSEGAEHALSTVWAKGYRLHRRTITTYDAVHELGAGAVVQDDSGDVARKLGPGEWIAAGVEEHLNDGWLTLPVVVLQDPEPDQ
jgi:hypothetical protein